MSTYWQINNPSDFFYGIFNTLKKNMRSESELQTENHLHFVSDSAKVNMRRYVLADGLELFLNRCNITEPVSFRAELNYDALDIRIHTNEDSTELSGGAFFGFTFFKDKEAGERRFIANYPIMNRQYISLFVRTDYLSRLIDIRPFYTDGDNHWNEIDIVENTALYQILQQVISTQVDEEFKPLFYQAKAIEITAIIIDILKKRLGDKYGEQPTRLSEQDVLLKARNLVQKQFSENLTIDDIAKNVYRNPSWLKAKYKETYGITIRQDIIAQRMSESIKLLSIQQLSVEEAAGKIGYEHVGHFINTFKKHFGCTPNEFMKTRRKAE